MQSRDGGVVAQYLVRFALVQLSQILLGFIYLWCWGIIISLICHQFVTNLSKIGHQFVNNLSPIFYQFVTNFLNFLLCS